MTTPKTIGVMALVCIITMVSCVEKEIHNIPAGYMGDVFIIHNAPDGVPLERSLLTTTYDIPANGILRSSSSMRGRVIFGPGPFFYVDAEGHREAITGYWPSSIHDTPENRADETLGIFFRRTGQRGLSDNPCKVEYQQYYVGTKSYLLDREQTDPLYEYLQQNPIPCE